MSRLWFWSGLVVAWIAGYVAMGAKGWIVFGLVYIALNALHYSWEDV
jgi:hypothetical protein